MFDMEQRVELKTWRRQGKKRWVLIELLVVLSGLILMLGDGQADTSLTGPTPTALPPIVIGVSNVQSGPSGSLGKHLMQGSMGYFDLVNHQANFVVVQV